MKKDRNTNDNDLIDWKEELDGKKILLKIRTKITAKNKRNGGSLFSKTYTPQTYRKEGHST